MRPDHVVIVCADGAEFRWEAEELDRGAERPRFLLAYHDRAHGPRVAALTRGSDRRYYTRPSTITVHYGSPDDYCETLVAPVAMDLWGRRWTLDADGDLARR